MIFYACPAGNTIAQTAGKKLSEGGTWWKYALHEKKLGEWMNFTEEKRESLSAYRALNGLVQIWLKENPGREILGIPQRIHSRHTERHGI